MPTTRVALDTRPLTDPVDAAAVAAYARDLRARGALSSGSVIGGVVGAVAVAVGLAVFFTVVVSIAASRGGFGGIGILLLVLIVLAAGFTLYVVVARRLSRVRQWRLGRFAAANGMDYWPDAGYTGLPGMIFSLGSSRKATDLVRATRPRQVDYANYQYTTGSGKNRTTHKWGYVAIRLDVPLPNIVLDAKSNDGFFGSNLPAAFDRDQRLSLEGDFDRHFSLYCPQGYEQDALYLFTPDIMARFVDNASALDVEIVDDWLFLYAKRDFSTLDPATWEWLTSVVAAFQDKFAQWGRWRDDRLAQQRSTPTAAPTAFSAPTAGGPVPPVPAPTGGPVAPTPEPGRMQLLRPPPGVAPQGRRLKHRVRASTIVIAAVIAVWWIGGRILEFAH